MFETVSASAAKPRVFAMPAGCDFPAAVVAGLIARMAHRPPEAMARVTLYLNTNRMKSRITSLFVAQGARFLPKLRLITQLDQEPLVALPPATSSLRRQLELARLIAALLDAQPELAPRAATFDLAVSLTRLMDEMQSEGVEPATIAGLDVSHHSAHWERAQAFLRIITPLFSHDNGPEARRRRAAAQLAAAWALNPPQDPVIVAGTTGSRRATAEFMQCVASLPQGALILPGYDFDLPGAVWAQMDDVLTSEDHPQFRFRRLMDRLGIAPPDIALWHGMTAPNPNRNALISLSLRPAPVTDQWLRDGPHLPDLMQAAADLTLIEAPSPRQEALAIALVLREAAENGVKAALITPDRNLSRQVTAALDRWRVIPDDSAGRPLALSASGRFLRHIAALFVDRLTVDRLIALLKHPLTASGGDRGLHLLLTRELELKLRRKGPAFPTHADISTWAAAQTIAGADEWARSLEPIFTARAPNIPRDLAALVSAHHALAETLAQGGLGGSGHLWQAEAGIAALALMQDLAADADAGGEISPQDYRQMFDALIRQREVRAPQIAHPDILIWGTIEARVQGCDLVILGGLNDGIWPKSPEPDPWLNRKMRKDAGLLLPDRQIGLAAHDFQQAVAAPRVVLTRAMRDAETETVPSRWLNRLTNLMAGLPERNGPAALTDMRARGQTWLQRAAALDAPLPQMLVDPALRPSPRPAPVPPVAVRPKDLALTAIETLITDPYAIYARYVLRLRPLPPMRAEADLRDRGTAVHRILEVFVAQRPQAETTAQARARLQSIAEAVFASEIPFPATRALWLARLMRAADHFLTQDGKHGGTALAVEERGALPVAGTPFTLTGTPDRIDRLPDGTLHLIDYKTGAAPKAADQETHRKQLLFAAVMAENGGFAKLGPNVVSKISYISLGSGDKAVETALTPDRLAQEQAQLVTLIAAYFRPETGYVARRAEFAPQRDYDHLARYGEWQTSDDAVRIAVGQKGDAP